MELRGQDSKHLMEKSKLYTVMQNNSYMANISGLSFTASIPKM
jgi:hypothetical protein